MADIWSYTDISDKEKECLQRMQMSGWRLFYRGQSSALWTIESTLVRCIEGKSIDELWDIYTECYSQMKQFASGYDFCAYKPQSEDIDFFHLSNARHLGFPAHLIDWTAAIETALYFAANENPDIEGAIWILGCREQLNDKPVSQSPFDFEKPKLICKEFDFIPSNGGFLDMPLGRLRRFRQNGFFSIIPKAYLTERFESLFDENYFISKLIIPPESKTIINADISPFVKSRLFGEDKILNDENQLLEFMHAISKKIKSNKNI